VSEERIARVSVRLLDREYQVACPADERSDLLDSAEYLDAKMREVRDSGKVVGLDRIAVISALNIANELIKLRRNGSVVESDVGTKLRALRERVESALEKGQQLEL
jgi:cell division protein ZapA